MYSAIRWACALALIPALVTPAYTEGRTFTKVKYLMPVGEKSKEVKAKVRFDPKAVHVYNSKNGAPIKAIEYADITAATYSNSKHPRWKESLALGLAIGIFALPVLFAKSKKHWLTIQTSKKQDYMVLRLDKKNFQHIITSLETHADLKVERLTE